MKRRMIEVACTIGTFSPGVYRSYRQRHGDEPVSPTFTGPHRSSSQTYVAVAGTS